jgi:transcription initiation factor TFIID subunit TAF12
VISLSVVGDTAIEPDETLTVIQLADEFDYSGTHFSCNTGVLSWTAAKVG